MLKSHIGKYCNTIRIRSKEHPVVRAFTGNIVKKSTFYTIMIHEQRKNPGIETETDKVIRDIVEKEIKNIESKLDLYQN